MSKYGRGTALRALVNTPKYDCVDYEGVPVVDATATMDDEGGISIFCVNRDMEEDVLLDVDLRSFGDMQVKEHLLLIHDDVKAVNTEEKPDNVAPVKGPGGIFEDGRLKIWLPKLSWNVILLTQKSADF